MSGKKRRLLIITGSLLAALLLFVILGGYLTRRAGEGALAGSGMIAVVERGDLQVIVSGSGTLEAIAQMRIHELGAVVFRYGLWIALPMIGMLLFINIVLGFISRIAPQMNVFAIGFPLTISIGLLGIVFTLPMLDRPVAQLLQVIADLFIGH